ncbi:MAG: MerR family transcriptional regulator [Actinomycetota bacterium]|nr:MerR family transcriptional regulator [Actinomycetota bacterium]
MKISELAAATGVPLATIKLYQREGLLMPGDPITRTRSDYGQVHVDRVDLIRTLAALPGYNYQLLRELVGLIDDSGRPVGERVAAAMRLLPSGSAGGGNPALARAATESLGIPLDEDTAVAPQLGTALAAAEAVGLPCSDERLEFYWGHMRAIAEFELSGLAETRDPNAAVQYAIVGTAVYEHLILALRRLAHQHLFPQQELRT